MAVETAFIVTPGASHQRFQQHVAGAELGARAARCRVQTGDLCRIAFNPTGDVVGADVPDRLQRHQGGLGILLVLLFQRRL